MTDETRPVGRPSKYDPAYCQQVLDAAEKGYSLTAFAGMIGVARSTINEWMEHHPEFSEAANAHKAKRSLFWESRLIDIAQIGGGTGAATATIFGIKNANPDDFADRVVNEHGGPNGGPLVIQVVKFSEQNADDPPA